MRWCGIEVEEQGQYEGTNAARFWFREHRRRRAYTAAGGGLRLHQATDDSKHKERFQEMHKLTRYAMRSLMRSIVVGYELEVKNSMNSGGKGMADSQWLSPLQLDSFKVDASLADTELQSYSAGLEVACSDGANEHRI
jgi:hypothetical protein